MSTLSVFEKEKKTLIFFIYSWFEMNYCSHNELIAGAISSYTNIVSINDPQHSMDGSTVRGTQRELDSDVVVCVFSGCNPEASQLHS